MNRFTVLLLIALLSGACREHRIPPTAIPPPFTTEKRIAVREFHYRGEHYPDDMGAYGYLVFTTSPTDETQARYERVCKSFNSSFQPSNETHIEQVGSVMVTYWVIGHAIAQGVTSSSCSAMISEYDYALANLIVTSIGKLRSPGPLLVAWETPFDINNHPGNALLFDLSDFDDADISKAFLDWRDKITTDPKNWRYGFQEQRVRQILRSFLQKYGDAIVKLVTPKASS